MGRTLLLLPLLLAGCFEPTTAGDPEPGQRFVGEWLVEQPFHAGYEASWFHFHEDGQLEHLRDCIGLAGSIRDASDSLRCQFGDRWLAPDADTLAIGGACSDERAREIVLGFPADRTAELISVGGEAGWALEWAWVWQKCGEADCRPTLEMCR